MLDNQEKFEQDTIHLHVSIEKKMKAVRKYEKELKAWKEEKQAMNLETSEQGI
jgi:hypothetical protein